MAKSRDDDDPIGIEPMLDGGGDVDGGVAPGRAYNSVQCLALLSCCFLFLIYSVAIDGTVGTMINCVSKNHRNNCGHGLNALPRGSSKCRPRVGSLAQETSQ